MHREPGVAPHQPFSVSVQVTLQGATSGARKEFENALQEYAAQLSRECERQEISNRPSGIMYPEMTANSVARAREIFNRFGARPRRGNVDRFAVMGLTISSAAVGIFGSYLHSTWQWATLAGCALVGLGCLMYLVVRRLI